MFFFTYRIYYCLKREDVASICEVLHLELEPQLGRREAHLLPTPSQEEGEGEHSTFWRAQTTCTLASPSSATLE